MKKNPILLLIFFVLIVSSVAYLFSCVKKNQDDQYNEHNTSSPIATSDLLTSFKVNVGGGTYEFTIEKRPNNAVIINKRQVTYDPNVQDKGVYVKSSYFSKDNRGIRFSNIPSGVQHYYIPFEGNNEPVLLAFGASGGCGGYDLECKCEVPGDDPIAGPGNKCMLEEPWLMWGWRCDGNCAHCDMIHCPTTMSIADDGNAKVFGIIIQASSVAIGGVEDRSSETTTFYGGNTKIQVSKHSNGSVSVTRQNLRTGTNYSMECYNFAGVQVANGQLVYDNSKLYWHIPFDLGTYPVELDRNGGGHEIECVNSDCGGICEKEVVNNCITCECKGGDNTKCDMKVKSAGVIVSGASMTFEEL